MEVNVATNQEAIDAFVNMSLDEVIGSTIFYQDSHLFSYGTHWPIAVRKDGVVWINKTKRSATSSRHVTEVINAVAYVPQPYEMHEMQDLKDVISGEIE